MNNGTRHTGRKDIIKFLRPEIALSKDAAYAWKKVKRFVKRYKLPVVPEPDGKPSLLEEEYLLWREKYRSLIHDEYGL